MTTATLYNVEELSDDNAPLLVECVKRVAIYQSLRDAAIHIQPRTAEGWLEFILQFAYEDGGKLTIGALQRQPGAPFEYHS
jgi:hypothetical protein